MWKQAISGMLDLLYPGSCAICKVPLKGERSLCDACAADLPRLAAPFCDCCGEMFEGEIDGPFECPNCDGLKFAFEFARPAMPRDERTLDLIHRLKYRREIHLADELGRLAAESLIDPRFEPALLERWPLIPVPLHRKRMRWRHFNQSAEIARSLSRECGLPLIHGLKRVRATETQTLLNRKQRMANLKGAFVIHPSGESAIEKSAAGAVLVDDVLTTGSTVNECAATLKRAGFRRVFVITVLRG